MKIQHTSECFYSRHRRLRKQIKSITHSYCPCARNGNFAFFHPAARPPSFQRHATSVARRQQRPSLIKKKKRRKKKTHTRVLTFSCPPRHELSGVCSHRIHRECCSFNLAWLFRSVRRRKRARVRMAQVSSLSWFACAWSVSFFPPQTHIRAEAASCVVCHLCCAQRMAGSFFIFLTFCVRV